MGAALLAVGIELLIGIGIGLIVTVIGLFFGNIIVFDSIALAILAGFLSHGLLGVHPALAVVIGIAVLLGLLLLHCPGGCDWHCCPFGASPAALYPPRLLADRRRAVRCLGIYFCYHGL